MTEKFLVLFKVLFAQSVLFTLVVCGCCCIGRSEAKTFDSLFIVYSVLLFVSLGTYIWAFVTRMSYPGQVCSGDFLDDKVIIEETAILLHWDIEHEFYLISCGKLFDWFLTIESIFFFFCMCATAIWTTIKSSPLSRFSKPVDETQAEQHRMIL